MQLEYHVVDVFTERALEGNALAVFTDPRDLDARTMQAIAREMHLSETTFIFPPETPEGAARLRIFTPTFEIAFAGHPTIGTAYVMYTNGLVNANMQRFVLEENVGPVEVRVDTGTNPLIWLTTPSVTDGGTFDRALCASALSLTEDDLITGLPCELLTAGNPNIYVAVKDPQTVDRVEIDTLSLRKLLGADHPERCLFVFAPTAFGAYSRMFAPEIGVAEDPATGSATGPLAAFMIRHGLVQTSDMTTRFYSEQGTKMGRRSILHILVHGRKGEGGIEIGGHVTPVATATMTLER